MHRYLLAFSILIGVGLTSTYLFSPSISVNLGDISFVDAKQGQKTEELYKMLFVGDVMLARHVETLTERHGSQYPFENVQSTLAQYDAVIGNFEAAVPADHIHTPDFTFQFSVRPEFFALLAQNGFTHLSLANNHTYDFDHAGFQNTVRTCADALVCFGNPVQTDKTSVAYTTLGETRVAFLALHDTWAGVAEGDIDTLLASIDADHIFAYIHWGEEYEKLHSARQEALAHYLIDNGVDTVIGHHPHVVQDIEIYKEKPIFYSLGNFIFDQYFSDDVQQGLAVEVVVENGKLTFHLVPFTSINSKSQPRPMTAEESEAFLKTIPGAVHMQEYTHNVSKKDDSM